MYALDVKNFSKCYDQTLAVDNISLEIPQGEFFGLLGRNGAGKSTLINCTTGISTPTSGVIEVFGNDVVTEYREARKKIGLCPQEFNVDIFASVEDILWYMGGFFGMKRDIRKKRSDALLAQLDLESHRQKEFRHLSGGLKRRVMIARAMIHDPELLILDEPTAGVDVELRHELWKYLRLINQQGKTIVFTSHYLEEVEHLCTRIAIINHGKIVALDTKENLMKNGDSLEKKYLEITKK
ncbi:MAG: ABC transporter ATP-binding protein [Candidatus Magasanikbacteria bacterium]|nr:ABC transporter ATP-binding protein [Candidatus Magasanikbacteria bacterium]